MATGPRTNLISLAGEIGWAERDFSGCPKIGQNRVMPQTLWKPSLVLALYRNREVPQSRFMQLATIRVDGRPANRTVVFRGFLGDCHQITMVSDVRSAKFGGLESHPWAEVCWYFSRTREQFRLAGRLSVVREGIGDPALEEARREAWRGLSSATRQSYTWPEPGQPRDPLESYIGPEPDPASPLPSFAMVVLDPDHVDHLELDGNPQNRWLYHREDEGRWTSVEVNP